MIFTKNKSEKILTFRPEKDVEKMLEKAKKQGVKFSFLANNALRNFLKTQGYGIETK